MDNPAGQSAAHSIASNKYVSFVTFRKSGAAVPSPVWITPLADGRAGFTTDLTTGKVKRLRNDSRVTLQACTMRGAIIDGSPIVEATAAVVTDGVFAEVRRAIRSKYGVMVSVIGLRDKVKSLFGKKSTVCAVVITFADSTPESHSI